MKTLVTIMAHGDREAQKAFDRHLDFWRAHGLPLLVMCPEDSQVRTGLQILLIGKRGHHGVNGNMRFRALLETLVKLDYDRHIIFEYDSLCLVPDIPAGNKDGVYGMVFNDDRAVRSLPGSRKEFEGRTFIHPPIVLNRFTMLQVLDSMSGIPDDVEHGFWDRWLGLACERRNIPVHCFRSHGLGYSQNTIGKAELPEACESAAHGAVLFHGVKSKEALQAIVDARQFGIGRLNGKSTYQTVTA